MLYTGGLCPPDPPNTGGLRPPDPPKVGLWPPEDGPTRWTSSGSDHFQSGIRKGPTRWTSSGSDYFKSDGTKGLSSGIALIHKGFQASCGIWSDPLDVRRVGPFLTWNPEGSDPRNVQRVGPYLGGRRPTLGGSGGRSPPVLGGSGGQSPPA